MNKSNTLLAVAVPLLVVGSLLASDSAVRIAAESSKYKVTMKGAGAKERDTGKYTFAFTVANKQTGGQSVVEMKNDTGDVKKLQIVGDRLVVLGGVRTDADVVTVIPLDESQLPDSFLCYGPQISPTGRYIVFQRFYPRFSEPAAASDILLLYDLQSPPAGASKQSETTDSRGTVIYPRENLGKTAPEDVWIEDASKRHGIGPSGRYLWLDSDREVLFTDEFEGKEWLVLVDVSAPNNPKIRLSEVPGAGLAELQSSGSDVLLSFPGGQSRVVPLP